MSTLSPGIEPTTRAFLDTVNAQKGPAIYQIPVNEGRTLFVKLQDQPVPKPAVDLDDRKIPTAKGDIAIRILRPKGVSGPLPALVYIHGAGWVFGDRDTHDRLLRDLATGAQSAVVYVEFSRSPEAKYPVAIEESYAVLKYVAENGKALNLDTAKLAVGGDSVGGNMTAAVTMLAKERGGPKIGFQLLFYPVTDAGFDTPSYQEYATNHFLTLEAMKWFWNQYLPDTAARKQPTASPLQASVEQLKGLPPALVINGEYDVLRDEGEAYAHKLISAGVPVTAVRFHGTIHDFVMLNALAGTPAARGAIAMACQHLRQFFGG